MMSPQVPLDSKWIEGKQKDRCEWVDKMKGRAQGLAFDLPNEESDLFLIHSACDLKSQRPDEQKQMRESQSSLIYFMLKHGQRMFGQIPLQTLFSFLLKKIGFLILE